MGTNDFIVSESFTRTLIKIKAAQLCRRSDFSRSDYDDLRQGMLVYLLEKAHLFDPARGSLEAFVTNALNSWVKMELRFRSRMKRRGDLDAVSLEGTAVEFNGDADSLDAIVGEADQQRRTRSTPTSPIDLIDLGDAVRHALAPLSEEDQDLLRHVAEHGVAATPASGAAGGERTCPVVVSRTRSPACVSASRTPAWARADRAPTSGAA